MKEMRMSPSEENTATKETTTDRYELHVIRQTGQVVRLTRVDGKGEHDVPLPYPVYATGFHAEIYGGAAMGPAIHPGIKVSGHPILGLDLG
jgi:hypothetical protein